MTGLVRNATLTVAIVMGLVGTGGTVSGEVLAKGPAARRRSRVAPTALRLPPSSGAGGARSCDSVSPASQRCAVDPTPARSAARPACHGTGASDRTEREGKPNQSDLVRFNFENPPWGGRAEVAG